MRIDVLICISFFLTFESFQPRFLRMAFESQYLGLQRGYDLGFEGFTLPASCLAEQLKHGGHPGTPWGSIPVFQLLLLVICWLFSSIIDGSY